MTQNGDIRSRIKTTSSSGLRWLVDILSLFSAQTIVVPKDYRGQVLGVKDLLKSDTSGLVNTVLDFSIHAAAVDFTIETNDKKLDGALNKWLENINFGLLGRVPVGVRALAREYFRERWKGSSHLLLRTHWETVDGWELPTLMWFMDGEDIVVEDPEKTISRIGDEKYGMWTDPQAREKVMFGKNEIFFVQKPYDAWSVMEPVPYLIRKGVFRNAKFLEVFASKGEKFVQSAVEYLMMLRRGTEELTKAGETVSEAELKTITEGFNKWAQDRKTAPATNTPFRATSFDEQIEHLIPEYDKALKSELFTAIERRILAGLGMIDIVQGVTTSRRESILNPKPLELEIRGGIQNFKELLSDVVRLIVDKNKDKHPKKTAISTIVNSSPMVEFHTDDFKSMLRALYDRGLLSKETAVELIGEIPFSVELERRENEKQEGIEEKMYPPVINNMEDSETGLPGAKDTKTPDKTGPEKKNFKNASVSNESGQS